MDPIDLIQTATVGELACGCSFDRDGIREIGEWVPCGNHGAPTRVISRTTVTNAISLLVA